ncbi:LysE family translocator [Sedimenticola selenatireducens]|jgi:threonine/homoserine/homoserine lactone efflux protein|uniref:LysE family translocator n=1 Tax=Sedimenticola selenatireducens TaxID=191960 RepID=A0A558DS03_9GAMM|nr:LysE family translocator [Sedimenticola selenatireducens]TVO75829.1 LysE family translocator [Sedimenticola selenatireducens]TVT63688.1 MAG: LysE family translocator [Sedimenticola selenatireducens]
MYFDSYLWAFLIAITLLTVSPGVDTLLVIRNTVRGGFRDGVLTSFAICLGLFVHAAVSAGGISLILMQSAWMFTLLKVAGACYLVWLGAKSLYSAYRGQSGLKLETGKIKHRHVSAWVSLREGFLSNVLNPKTVVFYMAFLPQFIQPTDPALTKSLFLAGIHFVIANIWQLMLVLMVRRAYNWLSRPRVGRVFDSLTGSIMVFFGLRLGLES